MRTRILYLFVKILSRLISKKQVSSLIKALAYGNGIDLLLLSYNSIGVLNWNVENSGEYFFIDNILPNYCSSEDLLFIDVGANSGAFSMKLASKFPRAKIIAFEPTKEAFHALKRNTAGLNISAVEKGLGATSENKIIFTSEDSRHNTIYKEVLQKFLIKDKINEEKIAMTTLDSYCEEQFITSIDFLKIDVEGYELFVLKGALKTLAGRKIHVIQFEFNEMNIVSRVFLKDFYDLLGDYNFYRIGTDSLVPILQYSSLNEIFQYQNIIAILK